MESGCSDDSPECICPCGCGCQNDINGMDLPFTDRLGGTVVVPVGHIGICASCAEGRHETPEAQIMSVDNCIALYENILDQLRKAKEAQS